MLVQLRRVVYLLVLLHFCTCVINSVSGTPSSDADVYRYQNEIKVLITKVEQQKGKVDGTLQALRTARTKYKTAAQSAEKYSNECREFAKEIETASKNATSYEAFFNEEKQKKAKELVDLCKDHAREVKNAAVDADKKADEHIALAENYMETVMELYKKSANRSDLLQSLARQHRSYSRDSQKAFLKLDDVRAIKSSARKLKTDAKTIKEETAKAQKEAEELENAVKLLENATHDPKTAPEAAPKTSVEEVKQRRVRSVTNNEEPQEKETEEAEKEPSTGKNTATVEQQNDQNALKEDGKNGGSKEESEKNKEAMAFETLKSQIMRTDSRSTATMNINISEFSDSSSSPALVHSPLLLLVMLCVLGSPLVY